MPTVPSSILWMSRLHINSIESFWSMLKRVHKETHHKLSK